MAQDTKNKNKDSSSKTIRVEIIESIPSSFFIQDLEKIDTSKITTKDLEYQLKIITSLNSDEKLIKIDLELDAYLLKKGKSEEESLFGIKSHTIFRTPDFNKIVGKDEKLSAPDDFIRKLLNICIGGIRGMLSTKLTITELSNVTLPLLDLSSIKEVKEHKK
ncbi:hypothetical protein [Maribacter sp. R77961]|uniref:hypothetical protein n=1 Tax=Maribacter sp. R77961 TaxID=3093871 RepID=UPI0037C6E319